MYGTGATGETCAACRRCALGDQLYQELRAEWARPDVVNKLIEAGASIVVRPYEIDDIIQHLVLTECYSDSFITRVVETIPLIKLDRASIRIDCLISDTTVKHLSSFHHKLTLIALIKRGLISVEQRAMLVAHQEWLMNFNKYV